MGTGRAESHRCVCRGGRLQPPRSLLELRSQLTGTGEIPRQTCCTKNSTRPNENYHEKAIPRLFHHHQPSPPPGIGEHPFPR